MLFWKRLFHLEFYSIYQLFLASIFCACWYPLSVQTWLCGRLAIRCAPLTAQIIAIHHLFTLSFGKSSCFTPWNYNLSPRPRKVNVSCVFFFFFVILRCFLKLESTSQARGALHMVCWRTFFVLPLFYALSLLVCKDVKVKGRCQNSWQLTSV